MTATMSMAVVGGRVLGLSSVRNASSAVTSDSFEGLVVVDDEGLALAIATPAAHRPALAMTAPDAGKHVLVKKPAIADLSRDTKPVQAARHTRCERLRGALGMIRTVGRLQAAGTYR